LIAKIFIISFLFLILSCGIKEIEFEKSKWNESFDGFYECRENMVSDLIENHLQKGMTYKHLIDLIGKPENFANLKKNTIGYIIMEDYGWDIDPVETKTLIIEITKDSLVKNIKIEHWKN
jgi:hypothetical protein